MLRGTPSACILKGIRTLVGEKRWEGKPCFSKCEPGYQESDLLRLMLEANAGVKALCGIGSKKKVAQKHPRIRQFKTKFAGVPFYFMLFVGAICSCNFILQQAPYQSNEKGEKSRIQPLPIYTIGNYRYHKSVVKMTGGNNLLLTGARALQCEKAGGNHVYQNANRFPAENKNI